MKDPDEDVAYEIMRQKKVDLIGLREAELDEMFKPLGQKVDMEVLMPESIPWHQKVGTVIPFSRTVDRDPNPRIPLSVPDYRPVLMLEAAAWAAVALAVGLAYWWVA